MNDKVAIASRRPHPRAVGAASTAILDTAEMLAQTRGYNGFSYADVAERLGVTKASLHYHFATKAALGRALVARYRETFSEALGAIDAAATDPKQKLTAYVGLYEGVLSNERMCLCGMFAAEVATLPEPMREELKLFWEDSERWLIAVIEEGVRSQVFTLREPPADRAHMVIAALEGAMLLARSYVNPTRFQRIARAVLEDLSADSG